MTNRKDFSKRITETLHILGFGPQKTAQLRAFMTRSAATDPQVIQDANEWTNASHPRQHLQVIARASLLLRVATGAAAKLLQNTPYDPSDLTFWWEGLGENRGLWASTDGPPSFGDLWTDISEALKDWETWRGGNQGRNYSFAQWHEEEPNVILKLSECERILLCALWI